MLTRSGRRRPNGSEGDRSIRLRQILGTSDATCRAIGEVCRRYGRPRLLDVGCGRGELLIALAPDIRQGVGIDIAPDAIAVARRRLLGVEHVALHLLPADGLADRDLGSFEVICFVGSLEHMSDPRRALRAARTRATPDGRIVVVVISPKAPHAIASRWALRWSDGPAVAHLGVDGLRPVAAAAGLRIAEVRPLDRGCRCAGPARALTGLLSAYDAVGGATQAVVLAPDGGVCISDAAAYSRGHEWTGAEHCGIRDGGPRPAGRPAAA